MKKDDWKTKDVCFDTRTGEIVSLGRRAAWDSRLKNNCMLGPCLERDGWDWTCMLDPAE